MRPRALAVLLVLCAGSTAAHAQLNVPRNLPVPAQKATFSATPGRPQVEWKLGDDPSTIRSAFDLDVTAQRVPSDLGLTLVSQFVPPRLLRLTASEPSGKLVVPATSWERGCAPIQFKAALTPNDSRVDSQPRTVTVTPKCTFSASLDVPGATAGATLVNPVCGGPIQLKITYKSWSKSPVVGLKLTYVSARGVEKRESTVGGNYGMTLNPVSMVRTEFPSLVKPGDEAAASITISPATRTLGAFPPAINALVLWDTKEWNRPEPTTEDKYVVGFAAVSGLSGGREGFLNVRRTCTFDVDVER